MKIIGNMFRYILNINTIWGFMILITFGFCVYQHYTPEKIRIPESRLLADETNTVKITLTDTNDEVSSITLAMNYSDGTLTPEKDVYEMEDIAWEFETWSEPGTQVISFSVKSDKSPIPGSYVFAINGKEMTSKEGVGRMADGKLVTLGTMTDAALDYAELAFEIAIGLVSIMVLFLGLMKVGEDAGIVNLVARGVYPIIRWLFPQVPKDHPANGAILMNVTTTILGLGNAATPFGLKAMEHLQDLNPNKEVATDSQIMLLAYNTAGLAILPTTLIALRKSADTSDPFAIILPCIIAGAVSTVVAIFMVKVLSPLPMFSYEAAIAEEQRDEQREAEHERKIRAKEEKVKREEENKIEEDNER